MESAPKELKREELKKYPDRPFLNLHRAGKRRVALPPLTYKDIIGKRIQNPALNIGASEHLFYAKDEAGRATKGDALQALVNDNIRDVKIDGLTQFLVDLNTINLTEREMASIRAKNYGDREEEEILKAKQIKKLKQKFGANAYGLYHAYSQGPAQLVARTLEHAFGENAPLKILNPPASSRDINIITENGKVYLEVKLNKIPITDSEGRIHGYFMDNESEDPSEKPKATFRFELKKNHGQWGFEFEKLITDNEDLIKIFKGEIIPEQEVREKYCPPTISFNIAAAHLIKFLNDESKDSLLREHAMRLLDHIKSNFVMNPLFPLDQQPELLNEFRDLFYVLSNAIKEPSGAEAFYFSINQRIRKIQQICIAKANDRALTFQQPIELLGQLEKSCQDLSIILTDFMDRIPGAAISELSKSLASSEKAPQPLITSINQEHDKGQRIRYQNALQNREYINIGMIYADAYRLEDPITQSFGSSSSSLETLDVNSESLRKSQNTQIVSLRKRGWLDISSAPTELAFAKDVAAPTGDINSTVLFDGELYSVKTLGKGSRMKEEVKQDEEASQKESVQVQMAFNFIDEAPHIKEFLNEGPMLEKFKDKNLYEHLDTFYHQGIKTLPVAALSGPVFEANALYKKNELQPEIDKLTIQIDSLNGKKAKIEKQMEKLSEQMKPSNIDELVKQIKPLKGEKTDIQAQKEKLLKDMQSLNQELEKQKVILANKIKPLNQKLAELNHGKDLDLTVHSRITANLYEHANGNIYIDVISSDFHIGQMGKGITYRYRIPGMIMTRYILTDNGFKLDTITWSNRLLKDMMLKTDKEMIAYASRITQAEYDELTNFQRAIAYSNEHVRRAWGRIASIYNSISELAIKPNDINVSDRPTLSFTSYDYNNLQQITTQIIADPFNKTLLNHYRSAITAAINPKLDEKGEEIPKLEHEVEAYKKMQLAMDIFIQEAQLQEENKLLAKVLKVTKSIVNSDPPRLADMADYISLMEKVRQIPTEQSNKVYEEMRGFVESKKVILSLANLKVALQKIPSQYSSTVTSYLTTEQNFPTFFMENKEEFFFAKMRAPVPSGALKMLLDCYQSSYSKDLAAWKDALLLVAMDDLFDEDGNVRKDISTIFKFTGMDYDWNNADIKKKLLESYFKHFIVAPLKAQLKQPSDAKNGVDQLFVPLPVIKSKVEREQLQNDLLDASETTVKNKGLRTFINEYSYSRNRYALQRTLSSIEERQTLADKLTPKKQATSVLLEADYLKRTDSSIGIPNLTRTLMVVNKGVQNPNDDKNFEDCIKLSNDIGNRSGGRVLGGMLLSFAGLLLLVGSVLIWPVTEVISPDLSVKTINSSLSVIDSGMKMTGVTDHDRFTPKTKDMEAAKKPGFFERVKHYPIKRSLDKFVEITRPKKGN